MSMRPVSTKPEYATKGTENNNNGDKLKWNDLTPTEQSAASLGVEPDAWKPIEFMNTAHYSTLIKNNAIDSDLAKQLEAYKSVASGGN